MLFKSIEMPMSTVNLSANFDCLNLISEEKNENQRISVKEHLKQLTDAHTDFCLSQGETLYPTLPVSDVSPSFFC
ncbi:hypothetical protein CCH79_00013411 [Gambusia affinis]|uniref:Uncharacterized protein n=1 Tax=Gambusia affinis TaxID=33528 RepID=A0A315W8E4_GAMAF|nr:hypothetical protein CCH79_00013411 [Gambusia affinis]